MTMEIVGNDAQFNEKIILLKDLEIYGNIKNKTKDTSFDFSDNFSFKIQGNEKLRITSESITFTDSITAPSGIFSGDITANGNIAGDGATNITGIAGVTASTLSGTLQTAAQTNITSLGTLSSLNVTGGVSIGGTLTYEDVTNIDSVGLITARTGIKVLAGGINAVGVITATSINDSKGELRNFPQVSVSSNRVLVSSDAGKHVINTGSGGWTINTSSGFSVGDVIRIVNGSGSNQILFQAGGVTTYSRRDSGVSGDHSIVARGAAIIICTASNEYYVSGDI